MTSKTTDLDKGLKIGILDIESTALEAEYGYMLCACVREVGKSPSQSKTRTFSILDHNASGKDLFSDRVLTHELIEHLDTFDLLITWYGSRFDFPFINTRALGYGFAPPRREYRRDLCFVARGIGKLKNNRLATWGRFLFGKSGKSFLNWGTWLKAMRGEVDSIKYIVDHCKKDVIETEKIYRRFMPLLGKLKRG